MTSRIVGHDDGDRNNNVKTLVLLLYSAYSVVGTGQTQLLGKKTTFLLPAAEKWPFVLFDYFTD